MKILAIGAHPDDLEIFVFGSLLAWKEMGAELTLAVATDGAAGGKATPAELTHLRKAEAEQSAALLGAVPRFLGFPDGSLLPDRSLIDALLRLLSEVRPDLVVTHAPNDYHADHRALSVAVSHAASFSVPVVYADTLNGTGFVPTIWVDVTRHFATKCRAILCHATQGPERFVALVTRQAAFRAGECNGGPEAQAEAFRFEPRFPFADIRALMPPPPPVRPIGFPRPDGPAPILPAAG
jgi:N-acetylglucosamine malate deacetylase 1